MGQGANTSYQSQLNNQLSQFSTPIPDIAQSYLRSFNRGGPIDVPSYQELYGSYRDVGQREANRQAASLTESFGSQGGRYSSDLLAGQGRLRENLFQDLTQKSGDLLQNLRGQQFGEAQYLGNLQTGINQNAMNYLFQNYLRQTSPPPLLGQGQQYTQGFGFGAPTTAIY